MSTDPDDPQFYTVLWRNKGWKTFHAQVFTNRHDAYKLMGAQDGDEMDEIVLIEADPVVYFRRIQDAVS